MGSQGDRTEGKPPICDASFWVAAAVVAIAATFSVLIMGAFATGSDTSIVMIAGLTVIIAGPALLMLMVLAKLATRAFCTGGGHRTARTALIVTAIVYCLGAPVLTLGTWRCVRLLTETPAYQEAAVEAPTSSVPVF